MRQLFLLGLIFWASPILAQLQLADTRLIISSEGRLSLDVSIVNSASSQMFLQEHNIHQSASLSGAYFDGKHLNCLDKRVVLISSYRVTDIPSGGQVVVKLDPRLFLDLSPVRTDEEGFLAIFFKIPVIVTKERVNDKPGLIIQDEELMGVATIRFPAGGLDSEK